MFMSFAATFETSNDVRMGVNIGIGVVLWFFGDYNINEYVR